MGYHPIHLAIQRAQGEAGDSVTEINKKPKKTQIMIKQTIHQFSKTTLALCGVLAMASFASASDKDTLNSADVKFVKHEAAAGLSVVKLAELGVQKASNADVKTFAQQLVTDHTGANTELKALAVTKGVELSEVIDPKNAETFQKLEKTTGADFDKHFLAEMVNGHKKCVSNFEEASTDSKDMQVKAFAVKILPTLKAHLAKAEALTGKEVSAN